MYVSKCKIRRYRGFGLTASWSIKTSIYHVYEEQTCRFPESLLQQFNFQRAEETITIEESEEAETEWKSREDQQ